jgi:hypothetical protein
MDITELILHDHEELRRLFALLDEVPREDARALGAAWDQLATRLEVHAQAEEAHFYPTLLDIGAGAGEAEDPEEETEDAITDHNEIRAAVARAHDAEVGSDEWWSAVLDARQENNDHIGEEERQALPDFRRHADLKVRHELGIAFHTMWSSYHGVIEPEPKDADDYIDAES